jgi:hypothetical protein
MSEQKTVFKGRAPTTGSIQPVKKTRWQRWKGAILGTALSAAIVAGAIFGLHECGQSKEKECKTTCAKYEKVFKRKFEVKCVNVNRLRAGLPPLLEDPLVDDPKCKEGKCEEEKPDEPKCKDDEVKVCLPVPEAPKPKPKPEPEPEPVAKKPKPKPKKPICGDNECNGEENAKTCPEDCGSECGDGFKTHDEKCDGEVGCAPDHTCVGCSTCKPPPSRCDPKLVTDDRAFKYELAAKSGVKSMASRLAGLSVQGIVDMCVRGRKVKIVELTFNKPVDADTLRQVKSAIRSKVKAKGFETLDMRIKFSMKNIRP